MKVSDINNNSVKVNLEAKVAQKGESREVNTRMGPTRIAEATIEDDTGSITLVLWGDQIDSIKEGQKIKIENGYVKEWNGAFQINIGKFGKLEVVEG